MNVSFLMSKDSLADLAQEFRKHKSRCHAGRPVNVEFRNELFRCLLEKFKQQGQRVVIKSSLIHSVAKELAKKHPFLLDQSLQRLRFCRRWCRNIQNDLASGNWIQTGGRTVAPPGVVSFSLQQICSTCKSKLCADPGILFSKYEPSVGFLLLVKKAPNRGG
jgi:hypothetical protein